MKQISSEDQKAFKQLWFFLSDSSNDLFLDCFFLMNVFLPVRPRGLIQFICVQIIDCRDDILLASDLFCARVTKHSNLLLKILVRGEGTMESEGFGQA